MFRLFPAQFDDFIPTFEFVLSQLEISTHEHESKQVTQCLGVLHAIFTLPLPANPLKVFGELCLVLVTQFVTNVNSLTGHVDLKQQSVDCLKCFLMWAKCLADKCSKIVDESAAERKKFSSTWKGLRGTIWERLEKLDVHKLPSSLLSTLVSVKFSICSKDEMKENGGSKEQWLDEVLKACPNKWILYKIVRNLMRYGEFSSAENLLQYLIEDCQRSKFHAWFKSLALICKCESNVADEKRRKFQKIIVDYHQCIRIVEAEPRFNRSNADFQKKFISLRFQFLHVANQILDVMFWAKAFQPTLDLAETSADKNRYRLSFLFSFWNNSS